MITDREILSEIQKRLPEIQQAIEMHEGFSTENKYLIKCKKKNYLLRHSKDSNYQKKKEEFDLIKEC